MPKAVVALLLVSFGSAWPATAQNERASIRSDRSEARSQGDVVSNGLRAGKAAANVSHSAALFLTDLVNRYRLDRATKVALQTQMPEITQALRSSGATGMLLEARFAADTSALKCGNECGPSNMTQRLLGGRLNIVGQGRDAVDVATLELNEERTRDTIKSGAPGRDETVLPSETRNYWVTLGRNRDAIFKEIGHKDLYDVTYLRLSDKAAVEQLKRSSYEWALDDMAHLLVDTANSQEAKLRAQALLIAREKARKDMQSISDRLKEALEAASRANADADKIALIAGLAGTASSVISSYNSSASEKKPSSATIELLRTKVDVETNMRTNEENIRSLAEKKSLTIWWTNSTDGTDLQKH